MPYPLINIPFHYMKAYVCSHNGMGDNIIMIGAIHYLLQFYEHVYFICKDRYYPNIKLLFNESDNVTCIPYDHAKGEHAEIRRILYGAYQSSADTFICGPAHVGHIPSRITCPAFLEAVTPCNRNYTIDCDYINARDYNFIERFYKDMRLNLTVYYDYFRLPITEESVALYETVKDYYIIFIQLKSSDGFRLNIESVLEKYLHDPRAIIICNDNNLYDEGEHPIKYSLAQKFVYNKIVNYNVVILGSDEIYVIDSCFIGILLPYMKTGKLRANTVKIVPRAAAAGTVL